MSKQKKALSPATGKYAELEKLVRRGTKGDKMAISELCENIAKDVLFKVRNIVGKSEGSEDIAQEVLLRVCKGIQGLKDPKTFNGWLAKIIINEKNRFFSKQTNSLHTLDIEEYEEILTEERPDMLPEEWLTKKGFSEIVSKTVLTLPERQREAIILHYYDDLSVTETAEVMGVKVNTASGHIKSACINLRKKLESQIPESKNVLFGGISVDVALSGALLQEGKLFAAMNDAFVQSIAPIIKEAVSALPVATTTATVATSVKHAVAGVCITAVVCTGIVIGLRQPQDAPMYNTHVENAVIQFDGGYSSEYGFAHLNPKYAQLIKTGTNVEEAALVWWITSADSDVILYSGVDESVGDALMSLGSSNSGEYILYYRISTQGGAVHLASRNFYITD